MKNAANEQKQGIYKVTDCPISYDGTWQRRGHGSPHAVVTSILMKTGCNC